MAKPKQSWFGRQPVGIRGVIIGAVIGAFATVIVAIIELLPDVLNRDGPLLDPAERAIVLIDLGYTLYALGLASVVPQEGLDMGRGQRELEDLFSRIDLKMPSGRSGPELYQRTRETLASDRDRQSLDLGATLGAMSTAGWVMTLHSGKPEAEQALREMRKLAHKMQLDLQALNILEPWVADPRARQLFTRLISKTEEDYAGLLAGMKSSIAGTLRKNYGRVAGDN